MYKTIFLALSCTHELLIIMECSRLDHVLTKPGANPEQMQKASLTVRTLPELIQYCRHSHKQWLRRVTVPGITNYTVPLFKGPSRAAHCN